MKYSIAKILNSIPKRPIIEMIDFSDVRASFLPGSQIKRGMDAGKK